MSTRTSGQETENNLTGTTRNEWGVSEHIVKTIGGDDAYTSGGLRSYRSELADRSTTLSDVADSNESVPVIQRDKMNDIVRWRAASEGLHRIAIGAMTQRGIPTIRGTRITVAQVLDSLSEHVRVEDVVEDLNGMITCDDVRDILIFAARLALGSVGSGAKSRKRKGRRRARPTRKVRLLILCDHNINRKLREAIGRLGNYQIAYAEYLGLSDVGDPLIKKEANDKHAIILTNDSEFSDQVNFAICTHPGILWINMRSQRADYVGPRVEAFLRSRHYSRCKHVLVQLRDDTFIATDRNGQAAEQSYT